MSVDDILAAGEAARREREKAAAEQQQAEAIKRVEFEKARAANSATFNAAVNGLCEPLLQCADKLRKIGRHVETYRFPIHQPLQGTVLPGGFIMHVGRANERMGWGKPVGINARHEGAFQLRFAPLGEDLSGWNVGTTGGRSWAFKTLEELGRPQLDAILEDFCKEVVS